MDKEALEVLRAEVYAQLAEIHRVYQRILDRASAQSPIEVESLAYQLHNLYCAYEDLRRIVADHFENRIAEGGRRHRELLLRMSVDIPGVRPALVSRETLILLDSLRAFRHFFRHAYTYELDPRKVRVVLEDALALRPKFQADLERFFRVLEGE